MSADILNRLTYGITRLWCYQQVHMIRRQDIRVNRTAVPHCALFQPTKAGAIVIVREKYRLPVVSAPNHVRRHIKQRKPGFSRHSNILVLLDAKARSVHSRFKGY
jgi:hypothetical protein